MKKKKGKDDFIRKHEYPGGSKAYREFIQSNLVYPKEAIENKIEGSVFAEYEVDFEGKVKTAKILHGIGYGCDEEALRLIKLLKFVPQNNHGAKISSTVTCRLDSPCSTEYRSIASMSFRLSGTP